MALVTVTKALTAFFNTGDGKVTSAEWMKELKSLTPETKRELAELVVAETGDELPAVA